MQKAVLTPRDSKNYNYNILGVISDGCNDELPLLSGLGHRELQRNNGRVPVRRGCRFGNPTRDAKQRKTRNGSTLLHHLESSSKSSELWYGAVGIPCRSIWWQQPAFTISLDDTGGTCWRIPFGFWARCSMYAKCWLLRTVMDIWHLLGFSFSNSVVISPWNWFYSGDWLLWAWHSIQ